MMDCHRQIGCSEDEVHTRLSQHLDGELTGFEAEMVDEHVKECARCRDEVAELRGVDRKVTHVVGRTKASDGFVGRVTAAIKGGGRLVRSGGRRVPRPVVWGIIAVAALGAAAFGALLASSMLGGRGRPLRPLGLRIGEGGVVREGEPVPRWRMRRIGDRKWTDLAPGGALAAGTELMLDPAFADGLIERPDDLEVYAAAGTRLVIAEDATDERGLSAGAGRLLVIRRRAARTFALGLPGSSRLHLVTGESSHILVEVRDDEVSVAMLAGEGSLGGPWGSTVLGPGEEALLAPERSIPKKQRFDVRAPDLEFAPPRLRRSPWPEVGGSAARDGRSPFALALPPRKILDLRDASGASAPVVGLDGTVYFLVGPAPGRLVGVRSAKVAVSARLPSPFVGDPAVAPDGSVLVATRGSGILRYRPEAGTFEFVVPAADIPRAGPAVAPGGGIYLVTGKGLAAFDPDGEPLWHRDGMGASSPPSIGPDGTVFVATIAGRLHALDPVNGTDRTPESTPVDEPFLAHVAVAPDGTAYAVSSSRYLVWRSPDGASGRAILPVSEYVLAPAIAPSGEVLVASSAGKVYRLPPRPSAPPVKPFFDAGESVRGGPIVDAAGRLVIWTAAGRVIVVESSGRADVYELGARESSSGAVTRDGALFFVTRDGRVFGR